MPAEVGVLFYQAIYNILIDVIFEESSCRWYEDFLLTEVKQVSTNQTFILMRPSNLMISKKPEI